MKKIIVASLNPVKAEAVQNAFIRIFPEEEFQVEPLKIPSGVPAQPSTDAMAREGAWNRARKAQETHPQAAYWVGVEGGIDYLDEDMIAFAWIVILGDGVQGSARSAIFRLPKPVQALVEEGVELGEADDRVFGRENSKQKSGAVGILTGDVVTRGTLYEQAVIMALIPIRNASIY